MIKSKNIIIKDTKVKPENQQWYEKYPLLSLLLCVTFLLFLFYLPSFSGMASKPDISSLIEKSDYWNDLHYCGVPQYYIPLFNTLLKVALTNPLVMMLIKLVGFIGFILLFYRFLRQLALPKIVCFFSSVIVLFLPQFYDISLSKLLTLVILPLLLEMMTRLCRYKNAIYFSVTSLLIGLLLSLGEFFLSCFAIITGVVLFCSEIKRKTSLAFSLLLLLGTLISGFMVSAAVNLPLLEAGQNTIFYKDLDCIKSFITNGSLSFWQLIFFFIPSRLLFVTQLENTNSAGILFSSFSPSLIFMAGFGILLRRDNFTKALLIVALLSIIFSFGANNPLFVYLVSYIPLLKASFYPAGFLLYFNLSILILAGIGIHELMYNEKQKKINQYISFFLLTVLIGVIFLLWFWDSITIQNEIITVIEKNAHFSKLILHSLKTLIGLILLAGLILIYQQNRINKSYLFLTFVLFIVFELWSFRLFSPCIALKKRQLPGKIINVIQQDSTLFRTFSVLPKSHNYKIPRHWPTLTGDCGPRTKLFDSFLKFTGFEQNSDILTNPFLAKYERLVIRNKNIISQPVPALSLPEERLAFDNNMLDMLNVKYIITKNYIHDQHYQLLVQDSVLLYLNNKVKPRVFFADSVQMIAGRLTIFDKISRNYFEEKNIAYLEEKPPFKVFSSDSNRAKIISYKSNFVEIKTSLKTPASLVLGDIYYPAGWRAYINGRKTKIYKTNYLLRSIFLKPGDNTVRFIYKPFSLFIGFGTGLLTIFSHILLLLLVIINRYKKKKNS